MSNKEAGLFEDQQGLTRAGNIRRRQASLSSWRRPLPDWLQVWGIQGTGPTLHEDDGIQQATELTGTVLRKRDLVKRQGPFDQKFSDGILLDLPYRWKR